MRGAEAPAGSLRVRGGPSSGFKIEVRAAHPLLFGRSREAHVLLNDPAVQPSQFRIEAGREGVRVVPLAPGAVRNGAPLAAGLLSPGDRLEVGAIRLEWHPRGGAIPIRILLALGTLLAIGFLLYPTSKGERGAGLPARESRGSGSPPSSRSPSVRFSGPTPLAPERTPLEEARRAFEIGVRKLEDRKLLPENLWGAIRSFDEARSLGATLAPPAPFAEEARRKGEEARRLLDDEARALKFAVVQSLRLGDRAGARANLERIGKLIPRGDDPRRRWADEMLRRQGDRRGR